MSTIQKLGVLILALKRAQPNKRGPGSSSGPKNEEEVVLKNAEKKKQTVQYDRKEKAATGSRQTDTEEGETAKKAQSSSAPLETAERETEESGAVH